MFCMFECCDGGIGVENEVVGVWYFCLFDFLWECVVWFDWCDSFF